MRALILLLVVLLTGCDRPVQEVELTRDVQARLAAAFGPGMIEIARLDRRGSGVDPSAPSGETRRVVYFDADLRLARDVSLGAWDGPGTAALVTAIGSGPRGIVGVNPDGNRAGDVLRVHGSAVYRRDGEMWRPVAGAGFTAPVTPALDTRAPLPPIERVTAALHAILRNAPAGTSPSAQEVIGQELAQAVANIEARIARLSRGAAIAAGPERGQYLRYVQALQQVAHARGLRLQPLVTEGTVQNLRLIASGSVVLALAQADTAALALNGEGPFAEAPMPGLVALGSLFPEPIHVIVGGGAQARTLADLAGARIAVGPPGSGTRATALSVLEAHGLADRVTLLDQGLAAGILALRDGNADAVIQVVGSPADELRAAMTEVRLRLLPLAEAAIATLGARPGLRRLTIAAGTYPGQVEPVPTVGTAALLVAGPSLTDSEAEATVRIVFDQARDLVALGSVQGAQISRATARELLTVPLHRGALRALGGD
jgi:TRAP transporter TAXI family solute receptor